MPRIDEGSYLVEFADVLTMSDTELEKLASWSTASQALFVTSPSIVTIRTRAGPVRVGVGAGSLISDEEPPVRHYVVSAPEWVDACRSGLRDPDFDVASGAVKEVRGVAVALDTSLPVALMLNSLQLEGLFSDPADGYPALVISGGKGNAVALAVASTRLVSGAVGGRAWSLLRYGLTLYTSCGRGPS